MNKKEEIDQLQETREKHLKSCIENGDKSHGLIDGLYTDATHYIYELLQNADDTQAAEVVFTLNDNALEIRHNGTKLFDYKDINSITGVGNSTKAEDLHKIGKFGAGFKSVFNITNAPEIYSGGYQFKITDYIVPRWLDSSPSIKENETLIRLPFKKNTNRTAIKKQLENLDKKCLLFLNHIKSIRWDKDCYSSQDNSSDIVNLTYNDNETEQYLPFKKTIIISNKSLNISIAFLLKDKQITAINDAKIFVFFPVEKENIGIKFLLHAPYKTTPSRETINFDDAENKRISQALAQLVADSLEKIKKCKLLTVDFLSLLPIKKGSNPLYQDIFERIKKKLCHQPLLPTNKKGWATSKQSLLARESKLTNLLNQQDCLTLFSKKYWLSKDITKKGKAKDLYNYLTNELKIKEINIEGFCNKINKKFIKQKPDKWLIKFYKNIKGNNNLYRQKGPYPYHQEGILRNKPILRLNSRDQLVCPDDEQIYFPAGRKSRFKTIKNIFIKNKLSKLFLEELGLKKPDGFAEIKEFIAKKYQSKNLDITKDKYLKDFKNALEIYQDSKNDKTKIINLLKNYYFIRCKNLQNQHSYQKAKDVYFDNETTKIWFKDNLGKEIYILTETAKLKDSEEFLEKLGVNKTVIFYGNKKIDIRSDGYYKRSVNGFNPDFLVHELRFALNHITKEKSLFLWKILLSKHNKLKGCLESKTRQDQPYKKTDIRSSRAGKLLESTNGWLYDKNNQLIEEPLSEILLDDLHDDYNKEHDNIEKLIKALGLKLDRDKEYEKETGKIVITQEEKAEYEQLKQEKEEREEKEKQKKLTWEEEVKPEDAKINTKNKLESGVPSPSKPLSAGSSTKSFVKKRGNHSENNENSNNLRSQEDKNKIGEWGERFAKRYLENEHQDKDVIWQNENEKIGIGCDFLIENAGTVVFYYEVKTKTHDNPDSFQMTRRQWQLARKEGDKYIILLISNAGKDNADIKPIINPFKLWKEGYIDATPVNIKLF